jgi:KDO2-lipid IV(A) lauroyltransferase
MMKNGRGKMARSNFQNHIEIFFLKAALFFMRLFPMRFVMKASKILGWIAYYIVPIRRQYVIAALSESFPNKTKNEILKIIKDMYINVARIIVGIAFIPTFSDEKIKNMMVMDEKPFYDAHQKKRGAVIMSAHLGNWELTAASMSKRYPISVIVANQSNPFMDDMMNEVRSGENYKTIPRDLWQSSARQVLKALQRNDFIAILADQDEAKNGCFVPFFGRDCSMPKGAALFALRRKCPLFTAFGIYREDGVMEVEVKEIPLPHTGDIENDIKTINTIYSQRLEKIITRYPHQWLWFHRKWKTKPHSRWS